MCIREDMNGRERLPAGLMGGTEMNAKKRWMETPCDIEIIRQAAQAGKLIASFGKRETIASKATREALIAADNGESWYVGYDADGNLIPFALIVDRRVEWYAALLSSVQMFALKHRLNLYAAFV